MLPDNLYGLDILRCYETSWLNDKGKPEIAILEAQLPLTAKLNTKEFKSYLNNINNTNFKNKFSFIENIQSKFNISIIKLMTPCNKQSNIDNNFMFRFLCIDSGQPFFGNVKIFNNKLEKLQLNISDIINSLRNTKSTPYDFSNILYSKIINFMSNQDIIVSCHFARKGGISLQSIRASQNNCHIKKLIMRDPIE